MPARLVDGGDGKCGQYKVVGEKPKPLQSFLDGLGRPENDSVIGNDAGALAHLLRVAALQMIRKDRVRRLAKWGCDRLFVSKLFGVAASPELLLTPRAGLIGFNSKLCNENHQNYNYQPSKNRMN